MLSWRLAVVSWQQLSAIARATTERKAVEQREQETRKLSH
jgi:hypothetical protein